MDLFVAILNGIYHNIMEDTIKYDEDFDIIHNVIC